MARPKQPYCPQCAGDIDANEQQLQAKLEAYISESPRAYHYEMAHSVFPKGVTSICLAAMNKALAKLGYLQVRANAVTPTYWVTAAYYKKHEAKLQQVVAP